MKAVSRLAIAMAAAVWGLAAPSMAQTAPGDSTEAPATDSVGPRELQNFNLQGTVTRAPETPAPQPSAAAPAARNDAPAVTSTQPATRNSRSAEATRPEPRAAVAEGSPAAQGARAAPVANGRTPAVAPRQSSLTVKLPDVGTSAESAAAITPAESTGVALTDDDGGSGGGLFSWPWLLAAVAIGAGGAFLYFRRHNHHAFAGGPGDRAYAAPVPQPRSDPQPRSASPQPAPVPAPAPPAAAPAPAGIISTRLRPWIDINFTPERCIVGDDKVRFDFTIDLLNSGSGPATDVLIEARLINAGADQDRVVSAFFQHPSGQGERIANIDAMQRTSISPQIIIPRDQLRMLEAGGRQFFVPLIAFNIIYRWNRGTGQSAIAYLLGRDTKGEKMAPLRADLGARVFRSLGARPLPVAVRS